MTRTRAEQLAVVLGYMNHLGYVHCLLCATGDGVARAPPQLGADDRAEPGQPRRRVRRLPPAPDRSRSMTTLSEAEAAGRAAFQAGAARLVPRDLLVNEGAEPARAWYAGWDQANVENPVIDVALGPVRIVEEGADVELCARCCGPMGPGSRVLDVETGHDMPMATAEWATIHAGRVR